MYPAFSVYGLQMWSTGVNIATDNDILKTLPTITLVDRFIKINFVHLPEHLSC